MMVMKVTMVVMGFTIYIFEFVSLPIFIFFLQQTHTLQGIEVSQVDFPVPCPSSDDGCPVSSIPCPSGVDGCVKRKSTSDGFRGWGKAGNSRDQNQQSVTLLSPAFWSPYQYDSWWWSLVLHKINRLMMNFSSHCIVTPCGCNEWQIFTPSKLVWIPTIMFTKIVFLVPTCGISTPLSRGLRKRCTISLAE